MELIAEDRVELNQNLNSFANIADELRGSLKMSRQLRAICGEEIKHQVAQQPTISPKTLGHILDVCKFDTKRSALARRDLREPKDYFYEADREVAQFAASVNPNEVLNFMDQYAGPSAKNHWLEIVVKFYPGVSVEQIRRGGLNRYHAIWAWASFSEFYALGLSINPKKKGNINHRFIQKTGRDRGSHHDNLIFAESAYCDHFLTGDEAFLIRANRLKILGIHNVQVHNLTDFLK